MSVPQRVLDIFTRLAAEDAAIAASRAGPRLPAPNPRPLETIPPCVHRGGPSGELSPCVAGCSGVRIKLLSCAIHGSCSPLKAVQSGVQVCNVCHDRKKPPPREIVPGLVDPIQTPPDPARPRHWPWTPEAVWEHVKGWETLAGACVPPCGPRAGQGVLICGEGRYWLGVVVCCRLLREVGYDGRILVWYRGKAGAVDLGMLAGLDVEPTDASQYADAMPGHQRPRTLDGYGAKTFAAMWCGLERAFFIDADAYFVVDPTPLFTLLDQSPFCYWKDTNDHVRGPWHGLSRREVMAVPAVQSGQMLIDVPRHWRTLVGSRWHDDHADYHCARGIDERHLPHSFGDQDGHRVALAYTGDPYLCVGPAKWRDPPGVFTYDHEGRMVIVHRCGSKLFPGASPRWDDSLPLEPRVRSLFDELAGSTPRAPGG